MQPFRALVTSLRLALAMLALAGWLGPAAAMSQAMAAQPTAQRVHAENHDHDAAHRDGKRAGHDATACCAAACGPAVAPQACRVESVGIAASLALRPAPDAFPPGHDPATAKPPPRTSSS